MAVKHVREYFQSLCDDYHELLENLRDMEEYVATNIVSPEQLDALQEEVNIVKDNYMRISYIMYLLDLPSNKKKQKVYNNTTKYNKEMNYEKVHGENKRALEKMREQ